MKNKKFRRMGKRLLVSASSSIVAGLLIVGTTGNVYAEALDHVPNISTYEQNTGGHTGMHMMHRWNSDAKAGNFALQLGLDKQKIKQEIKSGKTVKQILQDHDIVPGQIQKALNTSKKETKHDKKFHRIYHDFL